MVRSDFSDPTEGRVTASRKKVYFTVLSTTRFRSLQGRASCAAALPFGNVPFGPGRGGVQVTPDIGPRTRRACAGVRRYEGTCTCRKCLTYRQDFRTHTCSLELATKSTRPAWLGSWSASDTPHHPWTMFTGRSRLWGFPDFFNPQSCSDLDPRDRAGRLVDRAGLGCGVCNRHTAHCDHSSGLLFSDNDLNISRIPPSPFPFLILYCLLSFPNSSSAIPVAAFLFWVVSLSSSTSHTLSSFLPTPPTLFYP